MTTHKQGPLILVPAPYCGTRYKVSCECGTYDALTHTEPAGAIMAHVSHVNRSEEK